MLNNFFILHKEDEQVELESAFIQSVCLSHIIDLEKPINSEKLLRQYYTEPVNHHFNIALKNLSVSNIEEINRIFLLFTHPWYLHTEKGYSIFLINVQNADILPLTSLIKSWFEKQGMTDLDILFFEANITSQPCYIHIHEQQQTLLNNEQEFNTYYNNYISNSYNFYDPFIINKETNQPIRQVIQYLNTLNSNVQTAHPYLFNNLHELVLIKRENIKLKQVNDEQKKELKILAELFNINAAHNEMEYVLKFYHSEYEVLPLWYKRFGHIIKVLMGKRSFKSLFNDKHKQQ